MVALTNPYYPYEKALPSALTLRGAELIPYKILMYLMDLPDGNGHIPFDSNDNPRARLMRYLWHDGPLPLDQPLPTPEEKLSMLFEPTAPAGNTDEERAKHPKGYRLLAQRVRGQSQLRAESILKCYMGRILEETKFVANIGIQFEIIVNTNLETNTRTSAYQRSFDIEQCLHEALDGVNLAGIGTVSFCKADHWDNGSTTYWTEGTDLGRKVHCSVTWAEGGGDAIRNF